METWQSKQTRTATIEPGEPPTTEDRRIRLAFASETPVERGWGTEVLEISKSAIVADRLNAGSVPLLLDHDTSRQIGVVEDWEIGPDKIARATVRFSRSELASEVLADIHDGIRRNVSVGYQILKLEETKGVQRAVLWAPVEISCVSVPADATVGIGRAAEPQDLATPAQPADLSSKEQTMSDITTIENQARDAELARVREILSQGDKFAHAGGKELAQEYVRAGKPLDEFRTALMGRLDKTSAAPTADVSLSQTEIKSYSYARAMAAALAQAEGRAVSGFEVEISQDMERNLPAAYKRNGGIFVPMALQTRAPIATALYNTSGKGSETVFTEAGDLIDLLRNRSVAVQLGARVINGLQGPVSFPKQLTAATAYWMAENSGADVTASNATTGSVTLSPKTLQASTAYSRQLLAQATVDIESLVRADLAAVHALAWDLAVLHGTGAGNQPTGIYATAGVNSVAMGGVPTFGKLIDMITEINADNALLGALSFVTTPGMAGKLAQTLAAAAAGSTMIWNGQVTDGLVAGYRALSTNQVSAVLGAGAEHGLIAGDFSQAMIGTWGGFELVVDPYALKKQGMVEVTSFQMVDIALRHAGAFCKATGATIA